jgi:uroporphyrinogen-III decarboxylase
MNGRERFAATMDGQIPDRAPVAPKVWIDLAARLLGHSYEAVLADPALAMHTVVQAGLELGIDAARLFLFPARRVVRHDGQYLHIDQKGGVFGPIDIDGGWATQLTDDAALNIAAAAQMAHYPFWRRRAPAVQSLTDAQRLAVPSAALLEQLGYGALVDQALALAGQRLYAVGDCGSGSLAFYTALRGLDQALLDFYENPLLVHACMERGIEAALERASFFLAHGVRILRYNDSPANMSVISAKHWRAFIYPHLRTFCQEAHRLDAQARIYCHICGNILPVIEDLVEAGFDCIGPLDPLGGFSVAQARERVGADVILMGGVNTLSFVQAERDEILIEASRCIQEGGAQGRFVLGSGCVVPRDARAENLRALVDAAERHGRYRDGILEIGGKAEWQ